MAQGDDASQDERTEQATPFRREEFRKKGMVALSREVLSVGVLLAVGSTLHLLLGSLFSEFSLLSEKFFRFTGPQDITRVQVVELGQFALESWSRMALPLFAVTIVAALLVGIAQVGWHVTTEPLTPQWERINPLSGFSRIFSSKGGVEAVKAAIKMCVVGGIVYWFIQSRLPELPLFLSKTIPETGALLGGLLWKLFLLAIVALGALSAGDYWYQKFTLDKQMRMTKREAKEEFKLREGDPLIKSRIRAIQRRIASRRMMDQVPKADVIVTNPTHFAVALKYDPESMHAPKVIAKGAGYVALKIRELAGFHRVPLVENKPLARALYKEVEVNGYVPKDLYKAVAQVLAYVYRLKRSMLPQMAAQPQA